MICEWFALCDHQAAGLVSHPVLGNVPTCQRCADRLDLHLMPLPTPTDPTSTRIERDVPVTAALLRRFVSRNFAFGYNEHTMYQLGQDLYAVRRTDGVTTITARVRNAQGQDVQDLIALLGAS